jgi:probable rRNA maturation factor
MKLTLDVQYAVTSDDLPSPLRLRRWAHAALAGLRRRSVSVTLRVVDAAESRALNARYRGKRKPTNVLSFAFEPPRGVKSDLLGDVVICAPVVRREAREQGKNTLAHWAHMVVHGIMHLRGYDHQNNRDATIMERRERRILRALGYPDPYDAHRSRP